MIFLPTDLPLDLRHKKTRAIRRRLTKGEKASKTEKQHKREIHFPTRSKPSLPRETGIPANVQCLAEYALKA